jgi:hypothetical protein
VHGTPNPRVPHRMAQRGFALMAILALLTVGILYFVVGQLDAGMARRRQDEVTTQALAQAKEALIAYAITYHDGNAKQVFGYLPCPDIDGDGSGDALASDCGANDDQVVVGLLPYRQLNLDNYRDGAGACLWYIVSGTFKASSTGGMNPALPAPMNWDTQGRLAVLDSAGNTVVAPDDKDGGAAAVIVAVGPPLQTQNRSGDPCAIANAKAVYADYLDGSYTFPGAPGATVQVRQGLSGSTTNNDRLIWITPKEIFGRIKNRNDFGAILNSGIANIQSKLNSKAPLPAGTNVLPANLFKIAEGDSQSDIAFYNNWSNQFRYVACTTVGSYCFTVNNTDTGTTGHCDGVLLFGGADTSGGPRASAPRDINSYFESADAIDLLSNSRFTFTGPSSYDGSTTATKVARAADLGLCLWAGVPPSP